MDYLLSKKVKSWLKYVGKRCLVVEDRPLGFKIEVLVQEVSPLEGYVKFRFPLKNESWEIHSEWLLIECLE